MGDYNREFWLNDQPPAINAMRLNNVEQGLEVVDAEMNALPWKHAVRAASTENITALTGILTMDDVILVDGDKVLVKDQITQSQNGIYTVNEAGAWSRSPDANTNDKWPSGMLMYVRSGRINQRTIWVFDNATIPTLGSTALIISKLLLPDPLNLVLSGAGPTNVQTHLAGQTVTEYPAPNRSTFIANLYAMTQFRMIVNVSIAGTPSTIRIRPQAYFGATPSWQNLAAPPAGEANISTLGYRDTGWVNLSSAVILEARSDRFCRLVFEGGQPSTGSAVGQTGLIQLMFR